MTLSEAAEKLDRLIFSDRENGKIESSPYSYDYEFDIDENYFVFFSFKYWEYYRDFILSVNDRTTNDTNEELTKELQQEFCKWFGKVEFEETN